MEKATLNALDWNITKGDTVIPNKGRSGRWQIVQRFHFLSALKRMSVIAGQNASSSSSDMTYIVAVKGAPETLKSMVNIRKFIETKKKEQKMDKRRMTKSNDCIDD